MNYSWTEVVGRIAISRSAKMIEVREPKPGLRHNKEVKYVHHRFPVKGGIDSAEHIYRIMSAGNPILEELKRNEI